MAVADIHPRIADLEAFTLGTLDDASLAGVEAHVADCPICQERAAGASGDTLVQLLRRVHAQAARRTDTMAEAAAQTPAPELAHTEAVTLDRAAPATSVASGTDDFVPGELVRHDRYRVVRLLGEGGMGSVYEAEHRVMQRPVALKVINRAYTAKPAAVERFRREVRAAARLAHPNIVTTYDAEDAGNTLFLVMEYVEGISLARLVKERGPLPVAEACDYIRQAALGLQHAHERGMVHRDIKPDNLMLVASPAASEVASPVASAPGVVKVLDFGLAALTAERGDGLTDTNVIMGTPDYMAPEQAEDARTADIRADVYSLGCTLYYLLTGNVPYPADTSLLKILAHREQSLPPLRQERPEVLPELARVVARMLAKKPADRYQTPGEVAEALSQHVAELQGGQLSTGPAPAENQALDDERTIGRAFLDEFSRLFRMRPERDKAAFQGTWKVMRAEDDGKVGPPESRTITFDGNGFIFRAEGQATQDGSFRLDANKDPMQIDLIVGKGEGGEGGGKFLGIYKFDRDTILLCFRLEEKGNRPVTFSAPPKSDQRLLMLKRNR